MSPSHPTSRFWPLALLAAAACNFGVGSDLTKREREDAGRVDDSGAEGGQRCGSDAGTGACEPSDVDGGDRIWGCLGEPDPRPQTASKQTSLKLKVLYAYAQPQESETGVRDLTVKVCQLGDFDCKNVVTTDLTYENNFLVVKGLEAGLNYRIQLRGSHPQSDGPELLPVEYWMVRTVEGNTVEPKPILMFEAGVRDALATVAEVKQDPELGMLLIRTFDCNDGELEGVQVSVGTQTVGCGGECPTTVFYQSTSSIPDPSATKTTEAGRAGIFNLKPSVFNRITFTRAADNTKRMSFAVIPRPGWITFLHVWPWDYGTSAD